MDAADLRIFEAVARLGGMHKAAQELNTVQSNVTARIRFLEEELGVALFRRHSRGVTLTHAGQQLLPYAVKVASTLAEAKRAVTDTDSPSGPLAIGSLETTASLRLPSVVAAFGRKYPEVKLSLRIGTNSTLIEQVLNHELDGAFVCAPIRHPDIKGNVAFHEELVIATASTVQSLEGVVTPGCKILVKAPGCAYRDRLESWLEVQGVSQFDRLEFGTLEAIVGCVEAGLGFTMLPRSVLERANGRGNLQLHKLPPREGEVETLFIRRNDIYEFNALRAFLATTLSVQAGSAVPNAEGSSGEW
ncbi:MAG: LysR family transcriptional regulator [Pseudolabrys sp.]|nr:LysR family transcriptional regulator [Pseudolabrys sp.]